MEIFYQFVIMVKEYQDRIFLFIETVEKDIKKAARYSIMAVDMEENQSYSNISLQTDLPQIDIGCSISIC